MALFKKKGTAKKSSGDGLFERAKPATRHGSAAKAKSVPDAGFPTSEDERRGSDGDSLPVDADGRFLYHGEQRAVSSSNVAYLRYEGNTLYAGYKSGDEYCCEGVDPTTALGILHASSVGSALHRLELARGKFRKV